MPDEEVSAAEQSAWQRANADTRRVVGTLWFVIGVPLLDIAAAAIALIVASETHSSGALYVVAAIGAAGIGTIAAFVGVWTFQVIRAPVRQRNETRAKVTELTAVTPFPNVLIEILNFRQDFQDTRESESATATRIECGSPSSSPIEKNHDGCRCGST